MDSLSIPLPEHAVLQALLATTFTWLMTALGAATVFFSTKNVTKLGANLMLGFAGGVMLAASYWSLLAPAIQMSEHMGNLSWMPATIGFIAGALFLRFADMLLPHLHYYANVKDGPKSKFRRSTLLMFAVTLHNFPEGLAVGVAFGAAASGAPESGILGASALALGIGIQNIPEGAVISLPLRAEGMSKFKAFMFGQASGLAEPIAGIIGAAAVIWMAPILPYALAFSAGAMVFVVVEEVIPESQAGEHGDLATMALIFGFALMMVLDVALG